MGEITVVGLGWTKGQLTLDGAEALRSGGRVMLHTARCGAAGWLAEQGIPFDALDALYEDSDDFEEHVERAAQTVVDAAREGSVVYGVADVRDRTVAAILEKRPDARVIAGPPVEGALLACVTGETRSVEASDWEDFRLSARENCLVREIDSRELAAEVKLKLMEVYPEESGIWVLRAERAPERMPLYELDRVEGYDHRCCALIPACRDLARLERFDFDRFCEIIRILCSPTGCPWDRVQTHESLRPYIVEEAYEVIEAIDSGDAEHLYDELGDMLLQVVLHAEIARKHGEFDISDVTTAISEKMLSRHPHVFGGDHVDSAEEVVGLWTKNKMAERGQTTRTEVLRGVTRALPATLRAAKVLKRCAEVGLGDSDAAGAAARAGEALSALDGGEAALGSALLRLVNVARIGGVDPEIALNRAVDRLIERFDAVEREIIASGNSFESLDPASLRKYWDLVKL